MAIYAISGILLIFIKTDFLKFPQTEIHQLELRLHIESLGGKLRLKTFKVVSESNDMIIFNLGQASMIRIPVRQLSINLIILNL